MLTEPSGTMSGLHPQAAQVVGVDSENGNGPSANDENDQFSRDDAVIEADEEAERQREAAERKQVFKDILTSCFFMTLLMIGEFVGGGIANSVAVLSDAAHITADVASFVATLVFLKVSDRGVRGRYSYGYKRVEVLGSLATMMALWLIAGIICYVSAWRIADVVAHKEGTEIVDGMVMFITSLAASVCNILILCVLRAPMHGHRHSHGSHSHGDLNHANVSMHTVSHLINSSAMIIAGALIWAYPAEKVWLMQLADPIVSIASNIAGLFPTVHIIIDCVGILLQKYPHEVTESEIRERLTSINGVESIHALHVWEMTENYMISTVHVNIHFDYDPMAILKECHKTLSALGIRYSTVQVENALAGHHKHL